MKKGLLLTALVLAALLLALTQTVSAKVTSCGPPPKARPHQRSAGESFPPLPLPATPLRRSERKRPPSPPALIGKVELGTVKWINQGGKRIRIQDWKTDPSDMQQLMRWANGRLGIHYRSVPVKLDQFSYSPAELPIVYFTGHEPFTLSDEERGKIRRYVLDGGYVYGDACCGSDAFTKAFRGEIAKVFPDKPLVKLALDHPVFDAFYKIENVTYKYDGRKKSGQPYLEGIYVGCRTGVFFTPLDMSCGWSGHEHPGGKRYTTEDARRLGANMITYSLANYQLGRYFSTQKVYYQKGDKTRDEFVLGQVVHQGDWDPDPSEVANLLKHLERNSTVDVQFKRDAVTLKEVDPFAYPVLYMTGHRAFQLSKEGAAGLKRYLTGGGILLADACCGRASFDIAFRREIAKALPKHKLEAIPLDDPIYNTLYKIQTVRYTPLVRTERPNLRVPTLRGIKMNGMWAVVYSSYALGAGWSEAERPYSRGYSSIDALKLGMNIIVYALSH